MNKFSNSQVTFPNLSLPIGLVADALGRTNVSGYLIDIPQPPHS